MKETEVQAIKAAVERELVIMHRLVAVERAFGGYKDRERFKCSDLQLATIQREVRDKMTNKLAELGALKHHLARMPFGRTIMRRAIAAMDQAGRVIIREKQRQVAAARKEPITFVRQAQPQPEHIPFDGNGKPEKESPA